MWCSRTSRTASSAPSRRRVVRIIRSAARSKGSRPSSRSRRRSASLRSGSASALRSSTGRSSDQFSSTTWVGSRSDTTKTVRRLSWRSTSVLNASRSASTSSGPSIRKARAPLKVGAPGSHWSRNHIRCWEKERGAGPVVSRRRIAAAAAAARRRSRSDAESRARPAADACVPAPDVSAEGRRSLIGSSGPAQPTRSPPLRAQRRSGQRTALSAGRCRACGGRA